MTGAERTGRPFFLVTSAQGNLLHTRLEWAKASSVTDSCWSYQDLEELLEKIVFIYCICLGQFPEKSLKNKNIHQLWMFHLDGASQAAVPEVEPPDRRS